MIKRKRNTSPFVPFLMFRLSSVLVIQTSHVPDEYWQSLEVAHNMAFGYGYLTWEWRHGLRSSVHPFLFACLYKVLNFLEMDYPHLIIFLPKILQAIMTTVSDQYFYLLCTKLKLDPYWAKLLVFTNWFLYYCGSRTLINTFETCLTTIGLYYYPWEFFAKDEKEDKKGDRVFSLEVKLKTLKYLTIAAFTCLVRPTAITVWGCLVLLQMACLTRKSLKEFIFNSILPVALLVLPISLVLDYMWYGKFIIPAFNFLLFNIYEGVASFYGTHPFYWYIIQGVPVALGLYYLPFVLEFISTFINWNTGPDHQYKNAFKIMAGVVLLNLVLLSCVVHKEFRFVLPLTPMMMVLAVKASTRIFTPERNTYKQIWSVCLVAGFLFPTYMFGTIHQRGTFNLTYYLRNSIPKCNPDCSFLYLMPCHSIPLYSHIHKNISTRFITCEPPIMGNTYDESADFFANPERWLKKNWDDKNPPSHVTFFDNVKMSVTPFLEAKGYVIKEKFLQTVFAEENSGRYIYVYEPM